MKEVVAFGEIMMRLTTKGNRRLIQAAGFDVDFGGSEANVAVSCCNYGTPAAFVTRLPENALGQAAVNSLRAVGVDTSNIARGGDRIGVYYVEKGTACRQQNIVYDRAGSAMAAASCGTFDWEAILRDASWFHISGITPALSESCAMMSMEACRTANRLGIPVSCDLNYREKLWDRETAGRVMGELCRYVNICFSYIDEPQEIFGIRPSPGSGREESCRDLARELQNRFGFEKVAITSLDFCSSMKFRFGAMLYDGGSFYFSRQYDIDAVDRIGGGDAFCGGFIHAALSDMPPQDAIEFAVAAGCMKYTIEGDFNAVSVNEIRRMYEES